MKIKQILALFFTVMLMIPSSVFAAGTEGGTVKDPIQEMSSDTATIYIGKILTVSQPDKFPTITDFAFTIDNVKAWDNANVDTAKNGEAILPEAMPLPTPKTTTSHTVTVVSPTRSRATVGSFMGNANTLVADTTLEKYRNTPIEIKFTKAGYYMYKVTEEVSDAGTPSIPGMQYDTNSYFIVVYVCNKTDANGNTINGVYVHDITSFRNESGSTTNQPNLSDIQNVTDNNNQNAVTNNYSNYGKVGRSENTVGTDPVTGTPTGPNKLEAYRFYNDHTTHDVVVTNNVTGNLGDITKEFEYTVTLTGLEASKVYTTNVAAQDVTSTTDFGKNTSSTSEILPITGGKGTVDSTAMTFTSDSDGNAKFKIKLADNETFVMNALPATATYQVKELSSDHIARFTSESTENATWKMALTQKANSHSDLEIDTATETVDTISNVTGRSQNANVDNDGTVTIHFINHKDILPPTGVVVLDDYMDMLIGLILVAGISAFVISRKKNSVNTED